jgi:pyruvate,water dikinase
VIQDAHACGIKIGICGEAPSNDPEFAAFLVDSGIDSMSLNPDSFVRTLKSVAGAEAGGPAQPAKAISAATPVAA